MAYRGGFGGGFGGGNQMQNLMKQAQKMQQDMQKAQQELEETDVISVFINSNVSCEVLKKFKNLRVVTTRSTGYNHIDVKHCSQNHIAVFNVEKYGQSAVAQYTITLILALVRNLIPAYLGMQKLLVDHSLYEGRNLETLTLGVIGGGSIEQQGNYA